MEEKQKTFYLSKEEKLSLENSALKIENLKLLIEKEQKNQLEIIDAVCKRLNQSRDNILNLDLVSGIITFDKEKEDVAIRDSISETV